MLGEKIRILVTAYGTVPGANAHSAALLGMAAALRGELDLVTVKSPELSHQGRLGEARLFRVKLGGTPEEQRAGFARAVHRQLQAEPYDVVHVRGPNEGDVVVEAHRARPFRFIYEVGSFADEGEGPAVERTWRDAHERCLHACDLVLVGTHAAARHLAERGFGGKVAVVPPGVDVDTYDWWPKAPTPELHLLYLGSFTADRELPVLLGAVRELTRSRSLRVMLAGERDPQRRHRVRQLVRDFELDAIVEVRGEPKAVAIPSLIAGCDVGLVPASATPRFQEFGSLPEPLLEYLACRRPVVAAGIPAIAEVVRDEKEGLLYAPGDESSLAEAIEALGSTPELVERVTDGAYSRVRERFSGAARRRRIGEVYEMLVAGSQGFDAWSEAFEDPGTAQIQIPTGIARLEREPPPFEDEDTAGVFETSPGAVASELDDLEAELGATPTRIESRPPPSDPPPFDTDPGREGT